MAICHLHHSFGASQDQLKVLLTSVPTHMSLLTVGKTPSMVLFIS